MNWKDNIYYKDDNEAIHLFNQALEMAQKENFKKAVPLLIQSIEKNLFLYQSYNLLGKIYLRLGHSDKAKRVWEASLRVNPLNHTALDCLKGLESYPVPILKGKIFSFSFGLILIIGIVFFAFQLKKNQELLIRWTNQSTLMINEVSNKSLKEFKSIRYELKDQREQVMKALTSLKQPQTEKVSYNELYKKSLFLTNNEDFKKSKEILESIPDSGLREDLRDNRLFWLAYNLYRMGRHEEALKNLDQLLRLYPKSNKLKDTKKIYKRLQKILGSSSQ